MQLDPGWSVLEPGELDSFGFNFLAELNGATILSTVWTCTLYNPITANDPTPGSCLVGDPFLTNGNTQSWQEVQGRVDGAIYRLEAQVNLSDGRILKNWALVSCTSQ